MRGTPLMIILSHLQLEALQRWPFFHNQPIKRTLYSRKLPQRIESHSTYSFHPWFCPQGFFLTHKWLETPGVWLTNCQHCGSWWSGAKVSGYQYPHYWLNEKYFMYDWSFFKTQLRLKICHLVGKLNSIIQVYSPYSDSICTKNVFCNICSYCLWPLLLYGLT